MASPYEEAIHRASEYATLAQVIADWNDAYIAGLFREGLTISNSPIHDIMHDSRYPDGIPLCAPWPTSRMVNGSSTGTPLFVASWQRNAKIVYII